MSNDRVQSVVNGITISFVGNYYEVADGVVTKYYYAGAQRIAVRTGDTLHFMLGDHLGSTNLATDAAGGVISELRYKAWGEVRYAYGTTPTDYTFTGQYSNVSDFGLMYYGARWMDPGLGRFTQPDSIIPEQSQGVQAWDRYAYANNSPLLYTDPSGHAVECGVYAGAGCDGGGPLQPTLVHDQMGIGVSQQLDMPQEEVINGVNNVWELTTTVYSFIFEPVDWVTSGAHCVQGECSPWMLAGFLPFIPSSAGSHVDDIIDAGKAIDNVTDTGKGFDNFGQLKKALGDAGDGMEWHHIVEQSQIKKSGFATQQIQNVENALAVDAATHRKISGYFSSIDTMTGGKRVRDWLAGQSYKDQYNFGMSILRRFGVVE